MQRGARGNTKAGATFVPKQFSTRPFIKLLCLPSADIDYYLDKVRSQSISPEVMLSRAIRKKTFYNVVEGACKLCEISPPDETALVTKFPAMNKAWLSDHLKFFKGQKKKDEIPYTFVLEVNAQKAKHTKLVALRAQAVGGGTDMPILPDVLLTESKDGEYNLSYRPEEDAPVDVTVLQDDAYLLTSLPVITGNQLVILDPPYGLLSGTYEWDQNAMGCEEFKTILSLLFLKEVRGNSNKKTFDVFCTNEMAPMIEKVLLQSSSKFTFRLVWCK